MKKSIENGITLLLVIQIAVLPSLLLFFGNADEMSFTDIIQPMLIFTGIGLLLFTVFVCVTRSAAKAAFIAVVFLLTLMFYRYIETAVRSLFPGLYYWHILPITIVVLLHFGFLIWRKMPQSLIEYINISLCLVLSALIIINGAMAVPTIVAKNKLSGQSEMQTYEALSTEKAMPNIYYLIFDEYSSIAFMKKYFNYDNMPFARQLDKLGFNISYTSHNESIHTITITTNLVYMDYVVSDKSDVLLKEAMRREDPPLFKLLIENGYIINAMTGIDYGIENISVSDIEKVAATMQGETASDVILFNSFLYPMRLRRTDSSKLMAELEWIKNPENYVESNRFLLYHVDFPHSPYSYDRDGNLKMLSSYDWRINNNYLEQYIYATTEMLKIVEIIVNNDPNSIVFLTSDHGLREEKYGERFNPEDISNCFNAVYYQGESLDIEGLSAVNTMRYVLNRLLGMDYEMLEVPQDSY